MNINVLYIASDQRSGSTLLNTILGNFTNSFSVGELIHLNDYLNRRGNGIKYDWKCTCGTIIENCSFWSEVIKEYEKRYNEELKNIDTNVRRCVNKKIFYENYWRIVQVVSQVSGKQVIIDSSKVIDQYSAISKYNTNVKLLHIIRNGRAVSYSKLKRKNGYSLKCALLWNRNNILIEAKKLMIKNNEYKTVKYETIVDNLPVILEEIKPFYNLNGRLSIINNQIKILKDHSIHGSPHRFMNKITVEQDEQWKDQKWSFGRLVDYIVTLPLNLVYGYKI